jgi:hypothetical protein
MEFWTMSPRVAGALQGPGGMNGTIAVATFVVVTVAVTNSVCVAVAVAVAVNVSASISVAVTVVVVLAVAVSISVAVDTTVYGDQVNLVFRYWVTRVEGDGLEGKADSTYLLWGSDSHCDCLV